MEEFGPARSADSFSTTEVRTVNHRHLWKISGFSQCDCRYLETSVKVLDISALHQETTNASTSTDHPTITFRIRLHPQGNKESNKDFTFFQCFTNSTATPHYKSKFKFTIFNSRNEETTTTVYTGTQQLHGYFEYIRRDLLISHVQPTDELQLTLNITCTFDSVTKSRSNSELTSIPIPPPKPDEVAKDLEPMFRDGKHSDFTIIAGGREIPTHRIVIAARSPVFAAMLEPHTEEAQTGRVVLPDIDYEVMYELLMYMYTGRSPHLASYGLEILAAADRFQLPGLKEMADVAVRSTFTVESACRQLVYADMYSAPDLKREAINYIVDNVPSVTNSETWNQMIKEHPFLVTEVVRFLGGKNCFSRNQTTTSSSRGNREQPPTKRARHSDV
ncbi:unnamed protein product [Caenorhabditis auriculariae]|uniref:BTB domain-containing protein n=1 Tax=Caenorhabditis auriculariae TaxID=2777116 RepID=A0A8S1H9V0_9PELO|nr:unnamed protein product [Caenorhabditis auriculariae]